MSEDATNLKFQALVSLSLMSARMLNTEDVIYTLIRSPCSPFPSHHYPVVAGCHEVEPFSTSCTHHSETLKFEAQIDSQRAEQDVSWRLKSQ